MKKHKISTIIKTVKEETGRIFERKEIKIGDRGIQFIKGDIPFDDYVESTEEVNILNLNINFPIKILVHKYKEVETKEIEQDVDLVKDGENLEKLTDDLIEQTKLDPDLQYDYC